MTKIRVGDIGGKETVFFQAESREDAAKAGCPEGIYFYWEIGGERVYSPFEVVMRVQRSVSEGTFSAAELTSPKSINHFYRQLQEKQQVMIQASLAEMKKQAQAQGVPAEALKEYDRMSDHCKNVPVGIDGLRREK